jgi:hypothetical protein
LWPRRADEVTQRFKKRPTGVVDLQWPCGGGQEAATALFGNVWPRRLTRSTSGRRPRQPPQGSRPCKCVAVREEAEGIGAATARPSLIGAATPAFSSATTRRSGTNSGRLTSPGWAAAPPAR